MVVVVDGEDSADDHLDAPFRNVASVYIISLMNHDHFEF